MLPVDLQCAEFFKTNCMELDRMGRGAGKLQTWIVFEETTLTGLHQYRASAQTPKRVQHGLLGLVRPWHTLLRAGWQLDAFSLWAEP